MYSLLRCVFPAQPYHRSVRIVSDFDDAVEGDQSFLCPTGFLEGEVRFAEACNLRCENCFHVFRGTSVHVGYGIICRVLRIGPAKSIEYVF